MRRFSIVLSLEEHLRILNLLSDGELAQAKAIRQAESALGSWIGFDEVLIRQGMCNRKEIEAILEHTFVTPMDCGLVTAKGESGVGNAVAVKRFLAMYLSACVSCEASLLTMRDEGACVSASYCVRDEKYSLEPIPRMLCDSFRDIMASWNVDIPYDLEVLSAPNDGGAPLSKCLRVVETRVCDEAGMKVISIVFRSTAA